MKNNISTFRTNPNIISTVMDDGESVLLDVNTRQYYSLNETGSLIWQLITDGADENDIVSAIVAEFDIAHSESVKHVNSFLSECLDDKLIERIQ